MFVKQVTSLMMLLSIVSSVLLDVQTVAVTNLAWRVRLGTHCRSTILALLDVPVNNNGIQLQTLVLIQHVILHNTWQYQINVWIVHKTVKVAPMVQHAIFASAQDSCCLLMDHVLTHALPMELFGWTTHANRYKYVLHLSSTIPQPTIALTAVLTVWIAQMPHSALNVTLLGST